ncbi:hypothetical protein VFPPC_14146 [Pochonia chlamydosporia 170]|uniref:NADH:ubiquinone oxidoreductase 6.6kD subunit n=1 Tax=Pochonia chlamydosporia 170 TaxID=1380566 RepID=A0A179FAJ7_METCM|nr:hypothetical protein VFPPC_14146 [Pochonia chlamydosporia 170]OAQ62330.1 hypothetical protein VFPPC_14146 [Pochonia chlamydosporia 170]
MAHLNVKPDPAYLKHQAMQKTRHHFFRWTPRTARITFMYVVVVPAIFGYVAYKTDGLYNFRAKRRGDTIYER